MHTISHICRCPLRGTSSRLILRSAFFHWTILSLSTYKRIDRLSFTLQKATITLPGYLVIAGTYYMIGDLRKRSYRQLE